MIKAPGFWHRQSGPVARALRPLGTAYSFGAKLRDLATTPTQVAVPVICVGNPTLGGAGKTPSALAIADIVDRAGLTPHFLTRGYGGRLKGPLLVDGAIHAAGDVGDEPLLLARRAATHVARDRVAGAKRAVETGAQAIIMDDGFQNPTLFKTISFLVVDGAAGVGNGEIFPAGPLRASLGQQLTRADGLIIVGPGAQGETVARLAAEAGVPVLPAVLQPNTEAQTLGSTRLLAFCGIGQPEKFFQTLTDLNAEIADRMVFADHHRYKVADIAEIVARAENAKAQTIVTTEKDHVRFDDDNDPGGRFRARLKTVAVSLKFIDPENIAALIRQKLPELT